MKKRHCFTLDLKDNPDLVCQYEEYHRKVWPEVIASIKAAGIEEMEIYRLGTRLFMIMDVNEEFSFERKAQMDRNNPKVQQWEELMWQFQQPLEGAKEGEKWMAMNQIFDLKDFG